MSTVNGAPPGPLGGRQGHRNVWLRLSIVRSTEATFRREIPDVAPAARSPGSALAHRLVLPDLGALVDDGGPLGDPAGDVLLGEPDVGEHLTAAALLEELLRQPQRAHRHVEVAVLQLAGERRADAARAAAVLHRHH